jgi:hypothetical protein
LFAGLEKALAVHNDPNIPDGSLMQPWMIRKSTRALNPFEILPGAT